MPNRLRPLIPTTWSTSISRTKEFLRDTVEVCGIRWPHRLNLLRTWGQFIYAFVTDPFICFYHHIVQYGSEWKNEVQRAEPLKLEVDICFLKHSIEVINFNLEFNLISNATMGSAFQSLTNYSNWIILGFKLFHVCFHTDITIIPWKHWMLVCWALSVLSFVWHDSNRMLMEISLKVEERPLNIFFNKEFYWVPYI